MSVEENIYLNFTKTNCTVKTSLSPTHINSGSLEAKKEELKNLELKIAETRLQLDAKMVENEKVLAEISISANGQVNQANEKESHLLNEIANFLGTTVESVSEDDFGKFFVLSKTGLSQVSSVTNGKVSRSLCLCRGRPCDH